VPTEAELTLRPVDPSNPADAEVVADLHLASRRAAPMPPGVHPEAEVRAWLADRARTDEVWLAELDGAPAGYARTTAGWLDDLYVAPDHARRGVGSALLDLVKAQQPDGFALWVFEVNEPARAFYRRHGLVELERTDGEANEEREPDIRVAWLGTDPVGYLRGQIDDVDAQLADLLHRRAALTRAVQPHRSADSSSVARRDEDRERAIAAAMARRAPSLGEARIARIVHVVITESLEAASDGPLDPA
jgi:GNAT superfamily N-acetyltransferase/chorismate mutase